MDNLFAIRLSILIFLNVYLIGGYFFKTYNVSEKDEKYLIWKNIKQKLDIARIGLLIAFTVVYILLNSSIFSLSYDISKILLISLTVVFASSLVVSTYNNKKNANRFKVLTNKSSIANASVIILLVVVALFPIKSSEKELKRTEYNAVLYSIVIGDYVKEGNDVKETTISVFANDIKRTSTKVIGKHETNAYYTNIYGEEFTKEEYNKLREVYDEDTIDVMTPALRKSMSITDVKGQDLFDLVDIITIQIIEEDEKIIKDKVEIDKLCKLFNSANYAEYQPAQMSVNKTIVFHKNNQKIEVDIYDDAIMYEGKYYVTDLKFS